MKPNRRKMERAARLWRMESGLLWGLVCGLGVGSYAAIWNGDGALFWTCVIGYCTIVMVTRAVVALLAR